MNIIFRCPLCINREMASLYSFTEHCRESGQLLDGGGTNGLGRKFH